MLIPTKNLLLWQLTLVYEELRIIVSFYHRTGVKQISVYLVWTGILHTRTILKRLKFESKNNIQKKLASTKWCVHAVTIYTIAPTLSYATAEYASPM